MFAIAINSKSMGLINMGRVNISNGQSHSLFIHSQQTALMEGNCECFNGNVKKSVFHIESFISIPNIRLQTKVPYNIKRLSDG